MHIKELEASQLGRVAHERLRLPVVLSSSAEGEIAEQTGAERPTAGSAPRPGKRRCWIAAVDCLGRTNHL